MKVLVTGARGQLGRDVVIHCEAQGDLVIGVDRADLDVTDAVAVNAFVAAAAPDALINCAAYTAVDACETAAGAALARHGGQGLNAWRVRKKEEMRFAGAIRRTKALNRYHASGHLSEDHGPLVFVTGPFAAGPELDRPRRPSQVVDVPVWF